MFHSWDCRRAKACELHARSEYRCRPHRRFVYFPHSDKRDVGADMALVRKGSRRIVVDGIVYRWRIRHKPSYCQGLAWTSLNYAVEQVDSAGTVLVVKTGQPHPSNWVNAPMAPIRPADVANDIRAALSRGWSPSCPGKPFVVDRSADFVSGP